MMWRRCQNGSYLSAEFLLGPHLENNLINLGIYEEVRSGCRGCRL